MHRYINSISSQNAKEQRCYAHKALLDGLNDDMRGFLCILLNEEEMETTFQKEGIILIFEAWKA